MQATSPLLGLRGAASELAWRLGPVSRLRFHRPVGFLLHRRCWRYLHADQQVLRSSASAHSDTALWRSLPPFACQTMRCFAIHPPQALRAANRKTRIFMPENQKPKSHPACACVPPTNFIAARFLRKCDTVNSFIRDSLGAACRCRDGAGYAARIRHACDSR